MLLTLLDVLSRWAIPTIVAVIPLYGYLRGVPVYETFVEGAEEGLELAVMIVPYVVGIFVAMAIFRDSGAMDLIVDLLEPVLVRLGVPGEILPLAIIRPLSGGGALALTAEMLKEFGPDSLIGRIASTMQGSTDTTFYILTFYFGSVGVNRSRHALPVGLLGDLTGFLAAVWVVYWVFGPS